MYTINVTFEAKSGAKVYPYVGDQAFAQARLNKARHQSNASSVVITKDDGQSITYVHASVHAPWVVAEQAPVPVPVPAKRRKRAKKAALSAEQQFDLENETGIEE